VGTVRRDSVDADRWTARGTVKVTGDVTVREGELDGTVSIGGKLTADRLDSRGMLDVEGSVDVSGKFRGSGEFHTALAMHAGDAEFRGTTRATGPLSVDRSLTVRGSLTAPAVTAGSLRLEGEAQVPGEIVALSVSARFSSDSSLGTVRAASVVLHGKVTNLIDKVLGRLVRVTVRRVEGDSVDLKSVDVQFVRAPKITLGRDAHITEYEGTIVRRHPSSRVGFESRSRAPYGLSR